MIAALPMTAMQALAVTALGAAALLAASIASSVALWGPAGLSPGRRALVQWLPIAVIVFVALAMKSTDLALGVVFGTSVAMLSTATGALCTVAPVGPAPARWKRVWPFTLAAALIVFVSGFNGLLTWKHGVALALEALVLWPLWRDPTAELEWSVHQHHPGEPPAKRFPHWLELTLVLAAVVFAVAGGYAAVRGTDALSHFRLRVHAGAIGASLLSLMLVSPFVQSGRRIAADGASWLPVTAQIGVVLLNLCVLLPIVALLPYASAWLRAADWTHGLVVHWDAYTPRATVFPLATWRIDAVLLVILSVLFLPVSVGKWNLGKEEGVVLMLGYAFYLVSVMASGV